MHLAEESADYLEIVYSPLLTLNLLVDRGCQHEGERVPRQRGALA